VKVLELFSGIGGCAAALGDGHEVVGALDISSHVLQAYRLNFAHPTRQANLGALSARELDAYGADTWWMSPPCQPYTTRGLQNDLDDHRAASLVHLLGCLRELTPARVAMENVAGFVGSRAQELMTRTLDELGYEVRERVLCPTELGVPARRPRYYLVASREGLREPPELEHRPRRLAEFLEEDPDDGLWVPPEILAKHGRGMRVLDPEDPDEVCNTFTGAYGKTWRSAGSYLRFGERVRRFSASEILATLGFPAGYAFPPEFTRRQRYKYVGNSLSVVAVREALRPLMSA
jgi:site-specific DNA-cytosine methylase